MGCRQIGEYHPLKDGASSIHHHPRFQTKPIFGGIERSLGRREKLVDTKRAKVEVYISRSIRERKVNRIEENCIQAAKIPDTTSRDIPTHLQSRTG